MTGRGRGASAADRAHGVLGGEVRERAPTSRPRLQPAEATALGHELARDWRQAEAWIVEMAEHDPGVLEVLVAEVQATRVWQRLAGLPAVHGEPTLRARLLDRVLGTTATREVIETAMLLLRGAAPDEFSKWVARGLAVRRWRGAVAEIVARSPGAQVAALDRDLLDSIPLPRGMRSDDQILLATRLIDGI